MKRKKRQWLGLNDERGVEMVKRERERVQNCLYDEVVIHLTGAPLQNY